MPKDSKELIQNPHDKLFKKVYSDPKEAASFFEDYLPKELVSRIDLSTLKNENRSYISEEYRDLESDILYSVGISDTDRRMLLYLLFEHFSVPDKWARLRFLKYKCGIWDNIILENRNLEKLPSIFTVTFYQGKYGWNYSTEFSDLVEPPIFDDKYSVKFSHYLVDQSNIEDEQIRGALKGRIAQLLMKMAFHGQIEKSLKMAIELLSLLEKKGAIDYTGFFIIYLLETNQDLDVERIIEIVEDESKSSKLGDSIMTIAERLRIEGEARGKAKGKIEERVDIVLKLLKLKFGDDADKYRDFVVKSSPEKLERMTERILTTDGIEDVLGI